MKNHYISHKNCILNVSQFRSHNSFPEKLTHKTFTITKNTDNSKIYLFQESLNRQTNGLKTDEQKNKNKKERK